jgi:CHASE3 domain sensor protein
MRKPFALPLVPTYLLLVLVIVFAVASAWLGLARLDTIESLGNSSARSAVALSDLRALQNAVVDVETSVRGFLITGDVRDLETFERARDAIPPLLSRLRDTTRDDPADLELIERLVPLTARRVELSASAIQERRTSIDKSAPAETARPGKETMDQIRAVIGELEERQRGEVARDRSGVDAGIDAARRDRYLLAAVIVLVAVLLFFAVRRLRSLIPPDLDIGRADAVDVGREAVSMDGHIATLLQDALLRTRLAAATTPAESPEAARLNSVVEAMQTARDLHLRAQAELEQGQASAGDVVAELASLANAYSSLGGPAVKATLERTSAIDSHEKRFLIRRAAEWALEAMALRKRAGEITLHLNVDHGNVFLRVVALTDNPDVPLRLAPKETDEANVLQEAATFLGGTFVVSRGPTGFAMVLTLPADR